MTHSHDHEHGHSHEHTHSPAMSLEEKLSVLLSHWVDHNDSHKENFYSWAAQARQAGLEQIAESLTQAGDLSGKVTQQLKLAREALNG